MNQELFTYVEGIAHVGIAVPDIAQAQKLYELLGFEEISNEVIEERTYGVRVKMMRCGETKIELLEPLAAGQPSPIDSYIASKPYKMYHLAYICSDFDAQINLLSAKKFVMIGGPKPSEGLEGKRAVFMFNRQLGIVELCEK